MENNRLFPTFVAYSRQLARGVLRILSITIVPFFGALPFLYLQNLEEISLWKVLACHGVFMMGYAAIIFSVYGFRVRISRF